MKLIGKGSFTECYLNNDEKTVTLLSCDPIKECMAHGWFPEDETYPLFPSVEFKNPNEPLGGIVEYTMKYYPKTKVLKGHLFDDQWEIYKQLREISCMSNGPIKGSGYYHTLSLFSKIRDEGLRYVMIEALDACSNSTDNVLFEISPRNVRAHEGKLILLDCFFCLNKLKETRR